MTLEPLMGLRVVDLFAGSGALGLEALSRGAEHVDFVERRGPALEALESNLGELGLSDWATVWPLDLRRGMKPLAKALAASDLVLLDPPYRQGLVEFALEQLDRMELKPHVRVVAEHHAKDELPERSGRLVRARERRYGETAITIYVFQAESSGGTG